MVFESIVTDIINRSIGNYIENLDKKQLKIGIWGGDVVLKNLILRENALDDLNLPLRLIYGSLGKLVLKIPWTNLYSEPVVAQIEDLYLLICSKQSTVYDADKEAQYELQSKQAELQRLEDAQKQKLEKDKPKPDQTFTEKLTAQIVNNIQINIANVHIRYEDRTIADNPLSFGITLHSFDIYTTDSNWVKSYMKEQLSKVYKIADLDSFSIYLNCNSTLFSTNNRIDEYPKLFNTTIATNENKPDEFNYLIGPISFLANLQLNMNPQYDDPPFNTPKVLLNLEMQKLNIGITRVQFQALLKVGDTINRMKIAAPFSKYRPHNIPYKGHYKEWWKFAITCVLEFDVRRKFRNWSWEHMKQHRKLIQTYAKAYKELKMSAKPTANLTETCNLCEQKLDMFNLILVRNRVDLEIEKLKSEEAQTQKTQKSWFSWWSGSKTSIEQETDDNIVKKFEAAMTPEEKEKLYTAIGYQENAAQLILPESYEAIQMRFKLISLEIIVADVITKSTSQTLQSTTSQQNDTIQNLSTSTVLQPIITLKLSTVTCSIDQRPAANAIKLNIGVKEFKLTGLKQKSIVPVIVESQVPDEFSLLEILFETNPLDKKCNKRVHITARPLLIVYDAETIIQFVSVFSTPSNVDLSKLEGAAASKLANIKERSATGMQYLIDQHEIFEVNIKCMPNVILIPHNGVYLEGLSSMIVISLGELLIKSEPHGADRTGVQDLAQKGVGQENILEKMMERAYDGFMLHIDDIQVLVTRQHEKWSEALQKKHNSPMHILRPITLVISAFVCVIPDDPRLPKTKIKILIPSIAISATEERIFEAIHVLTSIPLPGSDVPEPAPLGKVASTMISASVLSFSKFLMDKEQQKKPESTTELTDEIVQYTDLYLSFKLNKFSVTMYKKHENKEGDIKTTSTPSPTSQSTQSPEKFDTPEIEFRSIRDSDDYDNNEQFNDDEEEISNIYQFNHDKILSVKVIQLEATFIKKTYEMVADVKLGAINVCQHNNWENEPKDVEIINTPGYMSTDKKYLLTISYVNANKGSPEFITKYNSVEQLITVNFSTLVVILHQECLQKLLLIADGFQQRLEKLNKSSDTISKDRFASAADDSIFARVLDTIQEENDDNYDDQKISTQPMKSLSNIKNRQSKKIVESIKIKLITNIEQVSIEIDCLKRSIASLKVKDLTAGVIIKSAYKEVSVKLRDIIVEDLNPETVHKTILSIIDENAFSVQFVLYNLEETSSYNKDDIKIDFKLGRVKIIFLNWFVTSILTFLNNFQAAQQAIANASAAAAETAKQTAVEAYEKSTRIKFNIQLNAPIIIVPVHSSSYQGIALDLGYISIINRVIEIDIPKSNKSPVLIDEIKFELKDMQLSKVKIVKEDKSHKQLIDSEKTDDLTECGLYSVVNILDPITFGLSILRNLTFGWYKKKPQLDISGHLKSIEITLFVEDYVLLMSILNKNLPEGKDEFIELLPAQGSSIGDHVEPSIALADVHRTETIVTEGEEGKQKAHVTAKSSKLSQKSSKKIIKVKPFLQHHEQVIDVNLVFDFQIDGFVANLVTADNTNLAIFGVYCLSLKGKQLLDGTLSTSIVLVDIQLEDIRPNNRSTITKYIRRKEKKKRNITPFPPSSKSDKDEQYMLDITAIMRDNDIFAEVRVCSLELIFSIDFLMNVAEFFKVPEDENNTNDALSTKTKISEYKSTSDKLQPPPKKKPRTPTQSTPTNSDNTLNLVLHIEEPDIVLIESMEDINTHAIIFNMETMLKLRTSGEKKLIFGEIKNLRMYMCSFALERRELTKHYIIHPCSVSLEASTPSQMGLRISLHASNIVITISPATLELISKAVRTVTTTDSGKPQNETKEIIEYDNIWDVKNFAENDYWFIKVDEAVEASENMDQQLLSEEISVIHKPEVCMVDFPSIVILFAAGIGYYTTPMLCFEIKMYASVNDWSSQMKIKAELTLTTRYYNSTLAVWEPIIEENEQKLQNGCTEYTPWNLNFELYIEKTQSEDLSDNSDDSVTKININSNNVLEITVSKSCLELLQMLGESFSQAFDTKGLIKPDIMSSYILENDTGFEINVNFDTSSFTLHECYMPNSNINYNQTLGNSLVFKVDNIDDNQMKPEDVKNCTIAAGGRVYLQKKELGLIFLEQQESSSSLFENNVTKNNEQNQDFLYVQIGNIQKEISLPVSKADERYFPLYRDTNQEPWGIVSEIKNEYGTTKINIHGVLKIKNHFTTSIYIHKKDNHLNKVLVGEIEPGQSYNVPLYAIYSPSKELYFSLTDYKCSVQGITWNECLTDLNYNRQIQCDPINTFEPFYINAIREKTEIYYEISSKYTLLSAYYTFHLRPPLYLRNALPIEIRISVAGCSVRQDNVQNGIEATENDNNQLLLSASSSSSSSSSSSKKKSTNDNDLNINVNDDNSNDDKKSKELLSSLSSTSLQKHDDDKQKLKQQSLDITSTPCKREDFLDYGEKTICPGDVLHLPTVKLTSKTGDTHSRIVLRLIQYLERDWICTTEISKNHDEYAVWRFSSFEADELMELELGVKFENRHGSLQLTIYCPFWMINKTGLMLSYRKSKKTEKEELAGGPRKASAESTNVLYHPPNFEGPILFSFQEKNFFGKKRAAIRVDNGEWSEKIPLDVAGSTGVVECNANEMTYHIGVHNHLTHNSLTKHITFLPFYVAINKASFAIELQDAHRPADPWIRIPENECVPLWPKIDTKHMLRLRIEDDLYVSVPFKYTEVQCTLLKMKNKYGGVNVDVQVTEGGIYITFTQYHPGDAPGLIVNHTKNDISYWEKGNVNERVLKPYEQELFTWSDPAGDKIIVWNSGKTPVEHDLRRDGVGQFQVGDTEDDFAYWISFLDGAQRVFLFTERETIAHETESTSKLNKVNQIIEVSIYGIGLSLINNVKSVDILYLRIASTGVVWETRKRGKARFKQMKIAQNHLMEAQYQTYLNDKRFGVTGNKYYLDGNKQEINFDRMILMKTPTTEREIQRTFYSGLWFQMKTSPFQLQVHAKINRLQIDNQLYDCIFPVLFASIAPPKSVATTQALKPFLECSIVQRFVPYSTVKQFKYFSMLIQEFHVKVDLLFINELLEMFAAEVTDKEAAKKFNEDIDWILQPLVDLVQTSAQQQQKHFFDYLHLGPIKIHVSFSMAGAETKALPSILSTILQGVGVTLTDVDDVVFRLAFFEREYQFFTQKQLVYETVTHYAGQAVKQAYVLILGLDVIGNPYGLVVGIKKGVEDLFYEPFQGAIQGPGEFVEGLVLGVKSLFGHTVGGAAGAVSKITGAMGKGLAALTFDEDYQKKRRLALSKEPSNFQEGIARSGRGLVMGVFDGVTGVFVKPITGARQEGVEGFFKGIGKGAVGLVARPTAGLVDFASGSLDAVKRAAAGSEDTRRMRPPRFLHPDGVVRPYCYNDSFGNKILKEIEKGKYAKTDTYRHIEIIVEGKEILLVSNHRIIYAKKSDLFGVYNVQWTYRWPEINAITSTGQTLKISLKKEEKKFFFSSSEHSKIIPIPLTEKLEYVVNLMNQLKQIDMP